MPKTTQKARESSTRKENAMKVPPLLLESWGMISSRNGRKNGILTTVSFKIKIREKTIEEAAEGKSLVGATVNVLKKVLKEFHPEIKNLTVLSYLIEDGEQGACAEIKAVVEGQDGERRCKSTGYSNNPVDATWHALTDCLSKIQLKEQAK